MSFEKISFEFGGNPYGKASRRAKATIRFMTMLATKLDSLRDELDKKSSRLAEDLVRRSDSVFEGRAIKDGMSFSEFGASLKGNLENKAVQAAQDQGLKLPNGKDAFLNTLKVASVKYGLQVGFFIDGTGIFSQLGPP